MFKSDVENYRKPVERVEQCGGVRGHRKVERKSRCCILNHLQRLDGMLGRPARTNLQQSSLVSKQQGSEQAQILKFSLCAK